MPHRCQSHALRSETWERRVPARHRSGRDRQSVRAGARTSRRISFQCYALRC